MMRIILLLLIVLSSSSLFGKDLTVRVIEGWKLTPVQNARVILKSNVGKFLEDAKTDSLGIVTFTDLTYGFHTVEVEDVGSDFKGFSKRFKLTENYEIKIRLQPTVFYERRQWDLEDEKYGPENRQKEIAQTDSTSTNRISLTSESEADTSDVEAEFPGGPSAMQRFISDNIEYPEISWELGEQGRVYVQFIIEPDGVITHVKTARGVSEALDNEAKRLVRAMPKWTPSKVKGKNVRTRCRLPITFTFN